ncbi:MAG TPA: L,D-transpeptidase, partial [Acidimicrobiia bacterium]
AVFAVAAALLVGTTGCFAKGGAPLHGKRIIYSIGQQRVVLIDENEVVIGDFLVSGNLSLPRPGIYHVIQEGKRVNGWSGNLRLPWFTRFTYGPTSDIGFHGIPIGPYGPIQSEAQLGQPLSAGCVRMLEWWAKFIFDWAPGGTPVEVQG